MSDLGISISLNSSQYTQGLSQIQAQTNTATQNIGKSIGTVGTAATQSGAAVNAFASNLGSLGQLFTGGAVVLGAQLAAQALTALGQAAVQFGKDSITAASEVQTINRALSFTAGGAEEGAAAYDRFKNTANELGISIEKNQRAFKNFVVSATQSGQTLQQAETEFKQVAIAITAMGLSAEDSNGVLLALGQIASKGTVSAEELRGQIGERLPGAFAIAARSIGVTESELNKMLQKGEVISKDFLPKFTAELEKTFGNAAQDGVKSYAAQVNLFDNSLLELKTALGEELIPVMIEFLQVGKEVVETFGGAKAIFEVLGKAIRGVLPVELFQQIGNGFKFIKDQYLDFLGVVEVSKKTVNIPIKLSFANKQDELASAQATLKQLRETVAGGDGSTLTGASAGKFFEAMQQIPKYERDILRLQAEIKGAAGAAGGLSKEQGKAAAAAKKQAEALAKIGEKGSLGFLENELKKINEQFQTTTESKLNVANLLGKKEDIEAQIKRLKELYGIIKGKPEAAAGSVAALQKQLAELNKQISESPKDLGLLVSLEKKALDVEKQLKAAINEVAKAKRIASGFEFPTIQTVGNLPSQGQIASSVNAAFLGATPNAVANEQAIIAPKADTSGIDKVIAKLKELDDQTLKTERFLVSTFENIKNSAFQSLGDGLAQVATSFGESIGQLIIGVGSFENVLSNALKELGKTILVEIPKVVGMGLVQSAFSPAGIAIFPANLPIALAGLALLGVSGIASGILAGNKEKQDNSITGQLASANQISAVGSTPQRAIGLGGQSVTQSDNITNVTLILETNGIIDAIQKQEYINNELRGQ